MYPKKKKKGPLIVLLLIVISAIRYVRSLLYGSLTLDSSLNIDKGDSFSKVYSLLSRKEKIRLHRYAFFQSPDVSRLQIGTYDFSGSYSPQEFIKIITDGPKSQYAKVRFLEGWSIYDIDDYLVKKGYISPGQYREAVSDQSRIQGFAAIYPFLAQYIQSHNGVIETLEGVLYPDTYYIDSTKPIIDQVLKLQLNAFRDKVAVPYSSQIENFSTKLSSEGYSFSMSWYSIITLSSVIEKEERNRSNKPIIAGVFLNRIEKGMRIDADITLCYGLKQGYEVCTPSVIARSIADVSNIYNTRRHNGLPPTPISNPSVESIKSLLSFDKTNNIYYLHDMNGQIWYAEDLQGHNNNKSKYL